MDQAIAVGLVIALAGSVLLNARATSRLGGIIEQLDKRLGSIDDRLGRIEGQAVHIDDKLGAVSERLARIEGPAGANRG